MIKGIAFVILIITYVAGGIFLEKHEMIKEPAYWALFGSFFGLIAGLLISSS